MSFSVIEEDETLMPLLHNTDKTIAKEHLKKILLKYFQQDKKYLIFDRLYFTHIHRTNSSLEDFKEIEGLIKDKSKIIFLKINEELISERIFNAMDHRSEKWKEYVEAKGDSKEIVKYYTLQQRKLLEDLKKSYVESEVFDTSNLNFEKIFKRIIENFISN